MRMSTASFGAASLMASNDEHMFSIGEFTLDRQNMRVWRGPSQIPLSRTEFRLLECLMWRAGYVFARNELLTLVWPEHERLNERVVDVHIGRLRQALRHSGGKDPIRTVRSIGYAFNEATPGAPPSRTASAGTDDRAFPGATQTAVSLFADASLGDVMPELMTAFARKEPCAVDLSFRASGLLREQIERGGRADMFAAANMDHALELEARGLGGPVVRFAGSELCALVRPGMAISPDNLLDLMLDPDIRVGISTPNADPCGDCAMEMFRRAGALRPDAAALLTAKALRLTGGPAGEQAPEGQNAHAWLMLTDKADVILTYRSNALKALAQAPNIDMVMLPRALEVRADFGLMVLDRAPKLAWRLALFILSPAGKAILARHGFQAEDVGAPMPDRHPVPRLAAV